MKELIILGNWKSNKSIEDARVWLTRIREGLPELPSHVSVILCPAYHHIGIFEGGLPFALGVQNLSPFDSGAYTGEVSAAMLGKHVRYALLGHSERRKHFAESDAMIADKVRQAMTHGIRPIVCVSDVSQVEALSTLVPDFSSQGMLLYEPLFAIGSGASDTPENANNTAGKIRQILQAPVLYGGSVVPDNVGGFCAQEHLSGVGVGGASLDADKFLTLMNAVL